MLNPGGSQQPPLGSTTTHPPMAEFYQDLRPPHQMPIIGFCNSSNTKYASICINPNRADCHYATAKANIPAFSYLCCGTPKGRVFLDWVLQKQHPIAFPEALLLYFTSPSYIFFQMFSERCLLSDGL